MILRALIIAWRNVLRHRRRGITTIAAMTIGIGTVIAVRGLMNSTQQAERDTVILGRYGALQVFAKGYRKAMKARPLATTIEDSNELRNKIKAVTGVAGLAPRLTFIGVLQRKDASQAQENYVTVLAIDPALERNVSPKLFDWVTSGHFFSEDSEAAFLATDPSLGGMGTEYFLSALSSKVPGNHQQLTLTGRINKALPGDNDIAIVPLAVGQQLTGLENHVTSYAVAVTDQNDLRAVKDRLSAVLGDKYEVAAWWELFPFIEDLQRVGRSFFDIVTLVFLCILLVDIANALLSRVMERRAEIGTMLATGIPARFVLLVFTFEGTMLAILGALSGAILGTVGVAIMHLLGVPCTIPGSDASFLLRPIIFLDQIAKVLTWSVIGGVFASLSPALRAARLHPIEALRDAS